MCSWFDISHFEVPLTYFKIMKSYGKFSKKLKGKLLTSFGVQDKVQYTLHKKNFKPKQKLHRIIKQDKIYRFLSLKRVNLLNTNIFIDTNIYDKTYQQFAFSDDMVKILLKTETLKLMRGQELIFCGQDSS